MQLVEAGKIKLDEPVQTYLPWFRVADADASKTITVRQLLNMNSGIPQSIGQEQIANFDLSDSAIENNVRALANVDLIAAPGERYEYSNANYVTLGMIIQAVSGQSYEDYIAEHIFKPLDMQNSFTSKSEAQKNGLVVGYQNWFGIPIASPNLPFSRGSLPAGAQSNIKRFSIESPAFISSNMDCRCMICGCREGIYSLVASSVSDKVLSWSISPCFHTTDRWLASLAV